VILTDEGAEKLRTELADADPRDLGRRVCGLSWRLNDKLTPSPIDIVELLSGSLAGQLGYDGTTAHTTRGRQSGFWARTPEGWRPTEIDSVVFAIDAVLRSALVEAIAARDDAETQRRMRIPGMNLDHAERDRQSRIHDTHAERVQAAALRVDLIEVVRKFVNGGGYYRGQLVAALRDCGAFDLDTDDVIDLARSYLRMTGPAGRVQLAGLARSVLAP
jgi:hypothetical protein